MDSFASVKFPKCHNTATATVVRRWWRCQRTVASDVAPNICIWQEMETNLVEDFQRSTYNNGFIFISKVSKVPL